jgi:hypothetical protein
VAVVLDVLNGEAGEAAGLKRYDVITEVSGKKRGRRRRPRAPDLEPRPRQHGRRSPCVRDGRDRSSRPSWPSARSADEDDEDDDDRGLGAGPVAEGDAFGLITFRAEQAHAARAGHPADRRASW